MTAAAACVLSCSCWPIRTLSNQSIRAREPSFTARTRNRNRLVFARGGDQRHDCAFDRSGRRSEQIIEKPNILTHSTRKCVGFFGGYGSRVSRGIIWRRSRAPATVADAVDAAAAAAVSTPPPLNVLTRNAAAVDGRCLFFGIWETD